MQPLLHGRPRHWQLLLELHSRTQSKQASPGAQGLRVTTQGSDAGETSTTAPLATGWPLHDSEAATQDAAESNETRAAGQASSHTAQPVVLHWYCSPLQFHMRATTQPAGSTARVLAPPSDPVHDMAETVHVE